MQRLGGVRVAGRSRTRASCTRAWAARARRRGRLGHGQRPPTELLGLARVRERERVRAESDQGEGDVVGKANSPRELEGAPVGVLRGTRFVSPLSNGALGPLLYRLVAYWLPIPAGGVAYLLFRRRYH
jgi:hypothetical protein